jgi:hypothetical protein
MDKEKDLEKIKVTNQPSRVSYTGGSQCKSLNPLSFALAPSIPTQTLRAAGNSSNRVPITDSRRMVMASAVDREAGGYPKSHVTEAEHSSVERRPVGLTSSEKSEPRAHSVNWAISNQKLIWWVAFILCRVFIGGGA